MFFSRSYSLCVVITRSSASVPVCFLSPSYKHPAKRSPHRPRLHRHAGPDQPPPYQPGGFLSWISSAGSGPSTVSSGSVHITSISQASPVSFHRSQNRSTHRGAVSRSTILPAPGRREYRTGTWRPSPGRSLKKRIQGLFSAMSALRNLSRLSQTC
jgi:hypothetical protein